MPKRQRRDDRRDDQTSTPAALRYGERDMSNAAVVELQNRASLVKVAVRFRRCGVSCTWSMRMLMAEPGGANFPGSAPRSRRKSTAANLHRL